MLRGLQVFICGVALAGLTVSGVTVASAQEPAKPVLTFSGDSTVVIMLIKPDMTADFEAVLAKYKEGLGKSDKPNRKEQLAGLRSYKATAPLGGNAAYVLNFETVVKGEEYDFTRIIYEAFPREEADAVFQKYKNSYVNRQIIELNKLP